MTAAVAHHDGSRDGALPPHTFNDHALESAGQVAFRQHGGACSNEPKTAWVDRKRERLRVTARSQVQCLLADAEWSGQTMSKRPASKDGMKHTPRSFVGCFHVAKEGQEVQGAEGHEEGGGERIGRHRG